MTAEQLLADLHLFPGRAVVVCEDVRTFAPVTATSPNRVHVVGAVEPHYTTDCAGCARQLDLVAAVSLLGRLHGGPQ
jgi:hypothetical protein